MSAHPQVVALRAAVREIETDYAGEGLRITVERAISFADPTIRHALRIERERTTASGRQGKPTPILCLVNHADQTPADMLRMLADLIEGTDDIGTGGEAA
jgi:hypothetical protein